MRYILLILLTILISGCSVDEHIDASDELRFSKALEKRYQLLEPLILHADLVDDYKSEKIWGYNIRGNPGYGGRYVLWRKKIPKNTIIKVKKAYVYSNILFSDFAYSVEIENSLYNLDANIPIYVDSLLTKEENGYIILDPNFLKEIKNTENLK